MKFARALATVLVAIALVVVAAVTLAAVFPPFRAAVVKVAPPLNSALPGPALYRMGGPTMLPTYQSGQYLNVAAYGSAKPQRFDVIVFHPPSDKSQLYVLRVIGLPGETIDVTVQGEQINGQPLTDPYMPPSGNGDFTSSSPITLGADQYFVLGDNRANSTYSRIFGPVASSLIVGKVVGVFG